MRLEEALDALPPWRWYERVGQRMMNGFASLQAAPVAACLLLLAGVGAGSLGEYKLAVNRASHPIAAQVQAQPAPAATIAAPAEIASISSIVRQPNSHRVEVRYNQLVPQRLEGSLDDPAIRQLLMLASQNSAFDGGARRLGGADGGGVQGRARLQSGGNSRCADGGAALRQE